MVETASARASQSSHTLPVLFVVVGSTRPERLGLAVAEWIRARASAHGAFDVELVDLARIDLPLLDEPHHPRLRRYTKAHTMRWSAMVSRADAFVFVTPEYNHSFPAALKNALDFLCVEWQYKPAAIASYGGVSAGVRSATALKTVLAALRMTVVLEAVSIPFFTQFFEQGVFVPNEPLEQGCRQMLDALAATVPAMRQLQAR